MKKVVITGASGFVGRALTINLINNGVEVVAIIRTGSTNKDKIPQSNKLVIIECDLKDLFSLKDKRLNGSEVFYHLAWEGSSGDLRSDERLQLSNVQYSTDAVRLAKRIGCQKFVGAGSIMEKETYLATMAQSNKLSSAYIYGMAKLSAHCLTKALAAKIEIDHIWPMITNTYGAGEKSPRFINTTLRKIINKEKLEFTAGTQNYDFIYIDDVAEVFRLIGEKGRPFYQYILGSGKATKLRNFIEQIGETLAPDQVLNFGDMHYTGIDLNIDEFSNADLLADTDFVISVPFKEGVIKTYDWLIKEENQ